MGRIKNVYSNKNLTTREEWNNYIFEKYNINIHKTDRGIYREARRTVTITKDDVGLAFSIHSIPDGPYNDKVDEYGMIYDFPNSKSQKNADYRDIESMKRVYDNNLPLFVVMALLRLAKSYRLKELVLLGATQLQLMQVVMLLSLYKTITLVLLDR